MLLRKTWFPFTAIMSSDIDEEADYSSSFDERDPRLKAVKTSSNVDSCVDDSDASSIAQPQSPPAYVNLANQSKQDACGDPSKVNVTRREKTR